MEEDREAWRAAVHGVAKSRTQLSDWTEPIPSPEYLRDPGIEPGAPALQADSLPAELSGKGYYKLNTLWVFVASKMIKTNVIPISFGELLGKW